jgi:hypothetical protein
MSAVSMMLGVSEPFDPDPSRARQLDARMRWRLADSLGHIAERSRGIVSFDEKAVSRLIAKLRGHERFPPAMFALYYDLVDAILEDRQPDIVALFTELCRQNPISSVLTIANLDPAVIGPSAVNRYCRMMDTDELTRFQYTTPPLEEAQKFSKECEGAIALMAQAAPELCGEFSGLVSDIILATGQSTDGAMDFAGASSFLLWGALFINPLGDHSPVSIIETLAHESAHSLLFGLMIDDAFVLNPDEQRFQSPLRNDPRPMDGIYHATFVVARMHYAMQRLLASGLLDAANIEVTKVALQSHQQAFADGLETINQHGRLTEHGATVMSSAARYMARAA